MILLAIKIYDFVFILKRKSIVITNYSHIFKKKKQAG